MTVSFRLTIAWLLLVIATLLSYFISDLDRNGIFASILAFKKFLLVGYIYLEGIHAHFVYRMILFVGSISLFIGMLIWKAPSIC